MIPTEWALNHHWMAHDAPVPFHHRVQYHWPTKISAFRHLGLTGHGNTQWLSSIKPYWLSVPRTWTSTEPHTENKTSARWPATSGLNQARCSWHIDHSVLFYVVLSTFEQLGQLWGTTLNHSRYLKIISWGVTYPIPLSKLLNGQTRLHQASLHFATQPKVEKIIPPFNGK